MSQPNIPEQFNTSQITDAVHEITERNIKIRDISEQILPAVEAAIPNLEFRILALTEPANSQQQLASEVASREKTIPYTEIGRRIVELDHAEEEANAGSVEERQKAAEEIKYWRTMADAVPNWSPSQGEAANQLAERKIQEVEARIQPDLDRLSEIRTERDALLGRFGDAWPTQFIRMQYVEIDDALGVGDIPDKPILKSPPDVSPAEVSVAPEVVETAQQIETELSHPVPETAESEPPIGLLDRMLWPVANYALIRGSIRMEEMRRDVPEVAALSPEEYKSLKSRFTTLRGLIEHELHEKGLRVVWDIDMSRGTRGKRYILAEVVPPQSHEGITSPAPMHERVVQESTAPKATPTIAAKKPTPVETAPGPIPIEEMTPEQLREVPIIRTILNTVNIMNQTNPNTAKRSTIARRVVDEMGKMGVSREAAEGLIDLARNRGLLFTNGRKHRGSPLFSTEKPADTEKSAKSGSTAESTAKMTPEEIELMVLDDVEIAAAILDQLSTLKHANQSIEVREILKLPVISGIEDKKARAALQRIRRTGLIQWQNKIRPAGLHARRLEVPFIKFPSVGAKKRWSEERSNVMKDIEAKLRQDYESNT